MKNLIVALLFIFSLSSSAQGISAYNRNTKFKPESESNYGSWSIYNTPEAGKMEILIYDQTPVGYKNIIEEINDILYYYKVKGASPASDKSLMPEDSKGLYDFERMNKDLIAEKAYVELRWDTPDHYIMLICSKENNGIVIRNK